MNTVKTFISIEVFGVRRKKLESLGKNNTRAYHD